MASVIDDFDRGIIAWCAIGGVGTSGHHATR